MTSPKVRSLAWASFDLANTIFSMNVLSLYFPLWVTQDLGVSHLTYSLVVSLSLAAVALMMPFLGAVSDHFQRRMVFLVSATLLCILCTGLLAGTTSVIIVLCLFAIAHGLYQLGLIFYDALLPEVSLKKNLGKTSGLGVSLGYVGTLIGLFLARPFVLRNGYQAAFLPTALFFLFFSLPCFLLVRDTPQAKTTKRLSAIKEGFRRIREGARYVKGHPSLKNLLWIYFLAFLGIQPVIYFMSIYAKEAIGLSDSQMFLFYISATSATIVGSYLLGLLTDLTGPKTTLAISFGGWILGLLLALFSTGPRLFFCAGPLVGIALGGTWVSTRVLVVTLSPKETLGQMLGFMGFFSRVASILGPVVWGLTLWAFQDIAPTNYRIAVGNLIFFLSLGLFFLLKKIRLKGLSP